VVGSNRRAAVVALPEPCRAACTARDCANRIAGQTGLSTWCISSCVVVVGRVLFLSKACCGGPDRLVPARLRLVLRRRGWLVSSGRFSRSTRSTGFLLFFLPSETRLPWQGRALKYHSPSTVDVAPFSPASGMSR